MVNYYDVTLPRIVVNKITSPVLAKYGQQLSVTGSFKAASQTTWNIQESTDGVKWDTKKSGSVTADQARKGVEVEYHRVITEQGIRKLYFRLALREKATGIVKNSYSTESIIQYPFQLNNNPVEWGLWETSSVFLSLPIAWNTKSRPTWDWIWRTKAVISMSRMQDVLLMYGKRSRHK
jgi:hypothetical protein